MKKLIVFLALLVSLMSITYADGIFDYYDTCSTGTGRSEDTESLLCLPDVRVDCCVADQAYHIHDLGAVISKDTLESLNVSFELGLPTPECASNGEIYVSMTMNPGDPSSWTQIEVTEEVVGGNRIVKTYGSVPIDFQYVLVGDYNSRCNVVYSDAGVTLDDNEVPEFSAVAAAVAVCGALIAFAVVRKFKD